MKKILFTFFLLAALCLNAQHSISGTFSPAKDYKWLIAYRLKPGTQNYIAQTKVQNGVFSMKIPENSIPGTYRLVYAVPQEEFYFDVIYNGKEDISLAFDNKNGVSFLTSKENILLNTYFKEINGLEQQLVNFYTSGNTNDKGYKSITKQLQIVQQSYEKKTQGTMANHFIRSNKPYIPQEIESVNDYVNGKKEHYFDALEIDNSVLQASGFLTNKLTNYVFTALPLEHISKEQTEKVLMSNIDTVNKKMEAVDARYKLHLLYSLWAQAAASTHNTTSDYIYNSYLKTLATAMNDQEIVAKIELHNRLRIGAIAPEIEWKQNNTEHQLSSLEKAQNYVIVFWSSTCSHCLRELPALHNKLKNKDQVKVVAVGLEDDDLYWKQESAKIPRFEHAIALGKWESEYAKSYDIHQTPTYFILDQDKRIIAKPKDDKEVIAFLERKN